jgi:signal transduction histidine kinase
VPRWWRHRSLRARLVLLGTCGLAGGFAISGLVVFGVLMIALQTTVDASVTGTARDVAALMTARELPDPVPVASGQLVQVVDAQGRIRYASIGADRLTSLLNPDEIAKVRAGERLYLRGYRLSTDGPIRVVGEPVGTDTVIVARPVTDVFRTVGVLRNALLVWYPVLVLLMALLAWRVIGAALRPVEELRLGAESITGAGRSDRLPVPSSGDEIHRLAVTLNGMLDRLAQARARQRAFVADAAHELRSPLAAMRTELEVAQRHGSSADLLADLLADVDRLSRLVNDLLLLARSDDAAQTVVRAPLDLAEVALAVGERYHTARVVVATNLPDPPMTVEGNRDDLLRVVGNLVDNAVRHAASRVSIIGYLDGGDAVLEVTDDGPGIAAADRERVFDRFTRLDDARARDAGGSGLGLAIVRELVRRHGGAVVIGDAGPGVRVLVRLPSTAG